VQTGLPISIEAQQVRGGTWRQVLDKPVDLAVQGMAVVWKHLLCAILY
jgi:hypothetical protein